MKTSNQVYCNSKKEQAPTGISLSVRKQIQHSILLLTVTIILFIGTTVTVAAQLGTYSFTGTGNCPNQNPAVNSQPANAVFGNFTYTSPYGNCTPVNDVFCTMNMNNANVIDLAEYFSFTVSANAGFVLNLNHPFFYQYC